MFFQLKEEIAAKAEEESNNKPKGKEEKKGNNVEEVRPYKYIQFILRYLIYHSVNANIIRLFLNQ